MTVPHVKELHRQNWQTLSLTGKREALQKLEDGLAELENRERSTVKFIPKSEVEAAEAKGLDLRGYYRHSEKSIYINPNRVDRDQPYDATSTLFHEADHAYQHHVVENPEQAEDPKQVQEWQWNLTDEGYIRGNEPELRKFGQEAYRWQPVEKHANEVALRRTVELHGEQFHDQEFQQWKARAEEDLAVDKEMAKAALGSNYVDRAHDYAHDKYLRQTEERSLNEQAHAPEPEATMEPVHPGTPAKVDAEELGQSAGETAGQAAGGSTAGPAGAAAGEKVGREAGQAAGEASEEAAEAAGQSTGVPAEAAEEAASEAPASDASGESEDRDYDYGYGYGL